MIHSFKHKGLERYFIANEKRWLDKKLLPRITRILDRLDTIESIDDMNLPGFYLHQLTGKRKGVWSVKVSGNWRLTFVVTKSKVEHVNLEDYH